MMSAQSARSVLPKRSTPNRFIKKRRLGPVVAYSEGPKTAFEYNRVRRALLKHCHAGHESARLVAPAVARRLFLDAPRARARHDSKCAIQTVQRAHKGTEEADETDAVVTANSDMADAELEKVTVRDTTRDEIDRNLKGLHAKKLCTRREMAGSVIIFLLQRMVPKEAIDVLTASTYRLFDVRALYYGDFVNRSIRVKINDEFVHATTTAYHSFDGFRAVCTDRDGNETEIAITHATPWQWA